MKGVTVIEALNTENSIQLDWEKKKTDMAVGSGKGKKKTAIFHLGKS